MPTNYVAAIAASANTVWIGLVALLLVFEAFQLNVIIFIAVLFGLSEAFVYPAILALLPQLMSKPRLGQANAWMQGSEQITNVVGPAAAGIVIGALGLSIALAINTALLAIGSGFIYLVQTRQRSRSVAPSTANLTGEISEGLRYAWQQPAIRTSLHEFGLSSLSQSPI